MVVVVDDEDRENEGDLIIAGDFVTPEAINFMATHAKGLICTPIDGTRLDELDISPMVANNTDNHETAFTVSVDAYDTETKFKIESYLQPETTDDETCQTILQEIETPMESQVESTEKTLPDANQITQIIPSTAVNVTDASMMVTQTESAADPTVVPVEDKRVNLNTATLEELDALPGVGPSTAKNIIAYRETHGGFAAPEEIMNVKRIGEKTFDKLKAHITV